jgi:DNA-binding NarL/FixJ family response regulator
MKMNNNHKNKIQVFVMSQQSLFQQAVEHAIADTDDMLIIGTTTINNDVLVAIDNLPPDVAMIDLDGQPENGLELARRLGSVPPTSA